MMGIERTTRTTDSVSQQEQKSLLGSSYSYVDRVDTSGQSGLDFANEDLED
jgi:hypothetical protein